MDLSHRVWKYLLGISLLGQGFAYAALPVQYASPMGKENWKMSGNPLRCGLSLTIPEYGIAYFEQYATKTPHFILRKWSEVQRPSSALVMVNSPLWKPNGNTYAIARTFVKPGKYGIYLTREPTLKLLTFLYKGYQGTFSYQSEQGFAETVVISPIKFQKVYSKYQQCLSGLLDFNYAEVRESVFFFDVDNYELTDDDQNQLRKIVAYVNADSTIEKVKITGHSDDTGRKGYNNAVSQFRAETVRNYLLKLGLPSKKLSTTWVGQMKPIARNDTEQGRAENRRVVVLLKKR